MVNIFNQIFYNLFVIIALFTKKVELIINYFFKYIKIYSAMFMLAELYSLTFRGRCCWFQLQLSYNTKMSEPTISKIKLFFLIRNLLKYRFVVIIQHGGLQLCRPHVRNQIRELDEALYIPPVSLTNDPFTTRRETFQFLFTKT